MKKLVFGVLILLAAGCSEMDCFSNEDYALKEADKFCHQANKNKALCESLLMNDEKVCQVSKSDECIASDQGFQIFLRIPLYECNQLVEGQCRQNKKCIWTMVDAGPLRRSISRELAD